MLTVINDLHIGVCRKAGTTPESAEALRKHLLSEFYKLLPNSDLLINGDLFDSFAVPITDVLQTYYYLADWLTLGYTLYLARGNHDLSKDSSKVSSFDLLCKLLSRLYPETVVCITEPTKMKYGYVIPHMQNQDLFDAALLQVPECETLFLHCNYDNKFTVQSDHSLNITKEQVSSLPVKQVIIGHEHQMKMSGKVLIPGNQVASSVSDWLGCAAKYKVVNGELVEVRGSELVEMDWRNLAPSTAKFVRITGSCLPEEAVEMTAAVAKYRGSSAAFVVACAVEVAGVSDETNLKSLEDIQKFSIMDTLKEFLTEKEFDKVAML